MRFLRQALTLVGSLGLLLALVFGVGAALNYSLKQVFGGVDPSVSAAIVAAVVAGGASVLTLVLQRRHERAEAIAGQIRAKKIEVYTRLVNAWFSIFGLGEDRTEEEEEQAQASAVKEMAQATPDLITWGSDSVVKAWAAWRRQFREGTPPIAMMTNFEDVLFTLRRDLGHDNRDLVRGDLLALWINDIDEVLAGTTDSGSGEEEAN